jgi:four helix bundle protein
LKEWRAWSREIQKIEELPCWNKARELCEAVLELTSQGGFLRNFSLRDQRLKAAGSVMDNMAEVFDDGSTREFIRFLGYA